MFRIRGTFVFGRAHQGDILNRVLTAEELQHLSREHLVFRPDPKESGRLFVERKSPNPVFVKKSFPGYKEFSKGETIPAVEGDLFHLWCGEHLDQDLPSSEIRLGLKVVKLAQAIAAEPSAESRDSIVA